MPRELQYIDRIAQIEKIGYQPLGPMASWAWLDDPKHLFFTLSRYKFVSKMFSGLENVLEIGCGDAFASRIVAQTVKKLTASDFDEQLIITAKQIEKPSKWNIHYCVYNPLNQAISGCFDGIYALDVLEHIPKAEEKKFLNNILCALSPHGSLLIGMPSLESQVYASEQSKQGHVNCKTQMELKKMLKHFFYNVFIFSMNDEVVHTGYAKMSHYNFALCCNQC